MAVEFVPIDRDTPYMFPPSVQDYLPDDHLARFVVEIVDQLDLNHLSAVYTGRGSKPFHPAMLVSLLFYGYATGVFSSRKLEKASYDSIAFRYVCANSNPDHDTINSFRKRFLQELSVLFAEILVVAEAMGLVKLGTVSLDGTKIKANTSKHKALSWDYANRLEAQLKQEVEDKQEIEPALEAIGDLPAALGKVKKLLADTGYFSEANVTTCVTGGMVPFIPEQRQKHNLPLTERFSEDPKPPPNATAVQAMQHRLQTQEGKAVYAKRKAPVETVFGIVKEVLGFRQFLLRGLDSVQAEWSLVCIGWNLKRMHALSP